MRQSLIVQCVSANRLFLTVLTVLVAGLEGLASGQELGRELTANVTPMTATPVVASEPVTEGQRVFFASHGFLIFIAGGRELNEIRTQPASCELGGTES